MDGGTETGTAQVDEGTESGTASMDVGTARKYAVMGMKVRGAASTAAPLPLGTAQPTAAVLDMDVPADPIVAALEAAPL